MEFYILIFEIKEKCIESEVLQKIKEDKQLEEVGIENRPKEVEEKQRFGDLEIDLVIGKDHQGALLTINDRSTGVLKMKKIESKDAEIGKDAAIELLEKWKPILKTITSDNGKEFAKHQSKAEALEIDYYFANPHCRW